VEDEDEETQLRNAAALDAEWEAEKVRLQALEHAHQEQLDSELDQVPVTPLRTVVAHY